MSLTMPSNASIFVSGHRGMVGSAIVNTLHARGYSNILTASRQELDLRDQSAVNAWFEKHKPEYVFLAAGKVGGILANSTFPADFLYDNIMIHANVIHASYLFRTRRLLYLGSSCIYPRDCPQPIREEYLLAGKLEKTNEPYAIAKISGIRMCEAYRKQYECDFISAMPTNLYGPNDNFDLESSHVLPALIRKFHEAAESNSRDVTIWGSGKPSREFLHVHDLADACIFLMENYDADEHINVGTGQDQTIRELAELVSKVVYPDANLVWDSSKPDGTPRKLLDVTRINQLGWSYKIELEEGIRETYDWYKQQLAESLA